MVATKCMLIVFVVFSILPSCWSVFVPPEVTASSHPRTIWDHRRNWYYFYGEFPYTPVLRTNLWHSPCTALLVLDEQQRVGRDFCFQHFLTKLENHSFLLTNFHSSQNPFDKLLQSNHTETMAPVEEKVSNRLRNLLLYVCYWRVIVSTYKGDDKSKFFVNLKLPDLVVSSVPIAVLWAFAIPFTHNPFRRRPPRRRCRRADGWKAPRRGTKTRGR